MAASRENTVNVPVEPTEAMIEAAEAHWLRGGTGGWSRDNPRGIWSAMLAVSPSVGGWREPVAWRYRDAWGRWAYCQAVDNLAGPKVITEKQPLYAAPPPPSVSTGKAIRKIGDEAVRLAEVQRSDFGPGEDGGWRFTEFMMSRLTPQPAEGCSSDEGAEPAVVAPKDQT